MKELPSLGMAIDLSRMNFAADFCSVTEPRIQKAFAAIKEWEQRAIANPPEKRLVGHDWIARFRAGNGTGRKNMVISSYKDHLKPRSKYLQHLVMESSGEEKDLNAKIVHQRICILGNEHYTCQHAYMQWFMCSPNNCFISFVKVLIESVLKICGHLAVNSERKIIKQSCHSPFDAVYREI